MKTYTVDIPFTGFISVDVKADSEEEAIDLAWEVDFELDYKAVNGISEMEEFELQQSICTCSVLHASMNEVEIMNIQED